MGAMKNFVKAAATVLPEIRKPVRKPSLNEKLMWTGIALVVYMVMAVTPLTGVPIGASSQTSYSSIIFASQQGTLMTLGIGPIVTAGLILQLLAGSEIIKVDFQNPDDRAIFTSATKLLTIIVIVVEASAYLLGGLFGQIAASAAIAIFFELFAASVIVMLLDELIQKGWGIGSGVSLFILAGVAQRTMWDIFSPIVVPVSGQGANAVTQFYGVIPATIAALLKGNVGSMFFRENAPQFPSIFGLLLTISAILIIVYVEGMRIEIPITSTKYRGFAGVYPIKLLYVSNIPVILFSALTSNIQFFASYLWKAYDPSNSTCTSTGLPSLINADSDPARGLSAILPTASRKSDLLYDFAKFHFCRAPRLSQSPHLRVIRRYFLGNVCTHMGRNWRSVPQGGGEESYRSGCHGTWL